VADAASLCHATANVRKRQAADHGIVFVAKDEKGIGEITALVFRVALEPPPESAARKVVGRPGWLPGHEEIAAGCAQGCPFCKIPAVRRPQCDTVAGDARHDVVET